MHETHNTLPGKVLKRIVIEATREGGLWAELEVTHEEMDDWYGSARVVRPVEQELLIRIPNSGGYTYRLEYEETDQYKRLAAALGHRDALLAIEALGKPVQQDWEDQADMIDGIQ